MQALSELQHFPTASVYSPLSGANQHTMQNFQLKFKPTQKPS